MSEELTKDDLRQFGMTLLSEIREIIKPVAQEGEQTNPEWLKSRTVRKLLDNMSAGSLQTLRISGKIRYKKVLGSYYYSKTDLDNLLNK